MFWHLLAFALLVAFLLPQDQLTEALPLDSVQWLGLPSPELSDQVQGRHLFKRYVYSTDQIVTLIDQNGQYGNKPSVFWTGFYGIDLPYFKVRDWANAKFGARCNYYLYTDMMSDADYRQVNSAASGVQESDLLLGHLSKAFARRSTNTVYVVIPSGVTPAATSTWVIWESPTLTRRPDWVQNIIQVDWPSGNEHQIWQRGDAAFYNPTPPG